jgi:hypothetical protein
MACLVIESFYSVYSKAVPLYAMKALVGRGGIVPTHSRPRHQMGVPGRRFTPGERTPDTHCTRGWVDPRDGLNSEARRKILLPLPGIEPLSPFCPVRSRTLY